MPVTLAARAPKASAPCGARPAVSVGIFTSERGLTQKQVCLLHDMSRSLTLDFLRRHIIPIITQKSRVSLRALDWAVREATGDVQRWRGV